MDKLITIVSPYIIAEMYYKLPRRGPSGTQGVPSGRIKKVILVSLVWGVLEIRQPLPILKGEGIDLYWFF